MKKHKLLASDSLSNTHKEKKSRKPRKYAKVKVLTRTWWRSGTGTKLVSEEIVEELRDAQGRKPGFMGMARRIPKCRLGGGNFLRATDYAHSLVDSAIANNGDGGAR